jgi:hypothetical protein
MKRLKRFLPAALAMAFLSFYASCTKEQKGDDGVKTTKISSENLLSKVKAFQEEEMKNGVMVLNRQFSEGEVVGRIKASGGGQTEASCIGDLQLELTSVYAQYKNGTCSSNGDYYMYFTFAVRHGGITFLNANNLPVRIKYTAANGIDYTKVLTVSNVRSSRGVTNITTAPVIVNEYCIINMINFEIDPQVSCPDGQTYSGTISANINMLANITDMCKNVAVAFVQPNLSGPGTVGLNGYFPCQANQFNPCYAYPNQVEFQFRKTGNSTWTTALLSPYLYNATLVSGLQAGTYEFQWRNKQAVAPNCTGPFSEIITRVIN